MFQIELIGMENSIFRYDPARSMESLEMVWVSKANAMQRRGRAGRVTSGVCFHLCTSHRFNHHLREQPVPGTAMYSNTTRSVYYYLYCIAQKTNLWEGVLHTFYCWGVTPM
jgi:hypothetical protein